MGLVRVGHQGLDRLHGGRRALDRRRGRSGGGGQSGAAAHDVPGIVGCVVLGGQMLATSVQPPAVMSQ